MTAPTRRAPTTHNAAQRMDRSPAGDPFRRVCASASPASPIGASVTIPAAAERRGEPEPAAAAYAPCFIIAPERDLGTQTRHFVGRPTPAVRHKGRTKGRARFAVLFGTRR